MSEREQNGARALRGMQAICLHPDYPHGLTVEVAASDIIADVLHAMERGGFADPADVLAVALRTFQGDHEDDAGGITPEGVALGHRYVMGNVNAYCPKCSDVQGVCVLDCDYDLDK